jgi:hypothetical protein
MSLPHAGWDGCFFPMTRFSLIPVYSNTCIGWLSDPRYNGKGQIDIEERYNGALETIEYMQTLQE